MILKSTADPLQMILNSLWTLKVDWKLDLDCFMPVSIFDDLKSQSSWILPGDHFETKIRRNPRKIFENPNQISKTLIKTSNL